MESETIAITDSATIRSVLALQQAELLRGATRWHVSLMNREINEHIFDSS